MGQNAATHEKGGWENGMWVENPKVVGQPAPAPVAAPPVVAPKPVSPPKPKSPPPTNPWAPKSGGGGNPWEQVSCYIHHSNR